MTGLSKNRYCAILFFYSLLFLQPGLIFGKVIGKDNRTKDVPSSFAIATPAVGMLFNSKGYCSAFCVTKNIIVTNAHCLFHRDGRWKQSGKLFEFATKTADNRFSKLRSVAGLLSSERDLNIVYGVRRRPQAKAMLTAPKDWALLRLENDACKAMVTLVPLSNLSKSAKSQDLGLLSLKSEDPWNRFEEPLISQFSGYCKFVKTVPGLSKRARRRFAKYQKRRNNTFHTCDSQKGQSGSPIIRQSENGAIEAVAVDQGVHWQFDLVKGKKRAFYVNMAVPAQTFYKSFIRFSKESIVSQSKIKLIQNELVRRRFYKEKPNGYFDDKMRSAIHKYEKKSKIPRLGLPTHHLFTLLGLK